MSNPRATSVGPAVTGADVALGGGDIGLIDRPARAAQHDMRNAAVLDRQADLLLSIGRFSQAERLAHEAAAIRDVAI